MMTLKVCVLSLGLCSLLAGCAMTFTRPALIAAGVEAEYELEDDCKRVANKAVAPYWWSMVAGIIAWRKAAQECMETKGFVRK